jgi:hypothetical protein
VAAAAHEGHRLAIWLVALSVVSALAAFAFRRAQRIPVAAWVRRAYAAALLAVAGAAVALGLVAGGGPGHLASRAWGSFTSPPVSPTNLNRRLYSLSSNGRTAEWHVGWLEFKAHPVLGGGAGSFEAYWNRNRDSGLKVKDAHSLYIETLAELGIPGLVLLVGFLAVPFTAIRVRHRPLVPVALGAYTALLVHAAYDWDWELPGVFLPGLFCGLAALVAARDESNTITIGRRGRAILLAAIGACAAFAFVALIGNISMSRAQSALNDSHFARAASNARRAGDWAPWSGQPWFLLGQAQAGLGQAAEAVKSMRRAVAKDPTNYRYWVGLSQVAHGQERVHAVEEVARLNPLFRP